MATPSKNPMDELVAQEETKLAQMENQLQALQLGVARQRGIVDGARRMRTLVTNVGLVNLVGDRAQPPVQGETSDTSESKGEQQ
jgi:hypothetical protein